MGEISQEVITFIYVRDEVMVKVLVVQLEKKIEKVCGYSDR